MKKVKYPYQQVYYRKHDVLQRDCVCKKKEEPNLIRIYLGKEEVGKVHLTDGFCVFGKEYRVEFEYNHAVKVMESWDENMKNKEKQSQSPCEHLFFGTTFLTDVQYSRFGDAFRLHPSGIALWGCYRCGLVTCLDPNANKNE